MIGGAGARQGILSLAIKDKAQLYGAYMQFLKGGGIFIPTNRRYTLGYGVFLLLSLPEDKDRLPVAGKVVWITPVGAEGNRQAGIGVQFSDQDNGQTRARIEGFLGGALKSERSTHTM
jgi:type IV pilus assembly protein PilZ